MARRGARELEVAAPAAPMPETLVIGRDASRELDREAVERYGMPSIVLMENAGRAVALETAALANQVRTRQVVVWAGPGSNGGDGYVAARHLHNMGLDVTIVPVGIPATGSDADINRVTCARMRLREVPATSFDLGRGRCVDVDALLGTGLSRPPEGALRGAIDRINGLRTAGSAVLAVDLPSGLDAEGDAQPEDAVHADVTVTFVAAKPVLLDPRVMGFVGRVVVADIGVPRELVLRLAVRRTPPPGTELDRRR